MKDVTGIAAEIADLLGLSIEDVAKLASSGSAVGATGSGRSYLQASVKNYCENIRRAATGRESPAVEQRRRLLRATADHAEIRAAIDAGTLVDAARVEARWSGTCRLTMSMAMAVPSRVAAVLPHVSRGDISKIEDVIREKLTTAANNDDEPSDGDEL
jgi:phage terminase Nu1 subunit (DNA packaging protein)